jgi:cytochrome c nitrite reductase small subunit
VTLTSLAWAAAGVPGEGAAPRPEGWIGTAEQWAQGLGIGLALVNLVLLVIAWRRIGKVESLRPLFGLLLVGLAVLPIIVIFFGYSQGMAGMETVRACGACHVMTAYVNDLRDVENEGLAALHYKNRYIRENHCYTCHSDYGMLGTISAKIDGIRHVKSFVTGSYHLPLKIAHAYQNFRCLGCHAESQKFLKSPGHPAEVKPQLISGEMTCLTCHAPAHTPKEARR